MKKLLYDMEKNYKDTYKAKNNLESDLRNLDNSSRQEGELNYQNKMTLDKNDQFGTLGLNRHERDSKLAKDFEKAESDSLESLK